MNSVHTTEVYVLLAAPHGFTTTVKFSGINVFKSIMCQRLY